MVWSAERHAVLQLLRRNVNRFRGGLVFKARRLFYHSTLGLRVIKKKKTRAGIAVWEVEQGLKFRNWSRSMGFGISSRV